VKVTDRDIRLVRDLALSQVLSRDQIIKLGYFASVSRCNRTMQRLRDAGLASVIVTPLANQRFYVAGSKAPAVVGERIAALLTGRNRTPRFIQHAVAVTDVRLALMDRGLADWRFEGQLWQSFSFGIRTVEVRPDGLIHRNGLPVLIEVDLGHVSAPKYALKLDAYRRYVQGGTFQSSYHSETMRVLTVTTGSLRLKHLTALARNDPWFEFTTFEKLGVATPGGWL